MGSYKNSDGNFYTVIQLSFDLALFKSPGVLLHNTKWISSCSFSRLCFTMKKIYTYWVFLILKSLYIMFSCKWNSCIVGDCSSVTDCFEEYDTHIYFLWVLKFAFFFIHFCSSYMEYTFFVLISPPKWEWTILPLVAELRGKPCVKYILYILGVLHDTFLINNSFL